MEKILNTLELVPKDILINCLENILKVKMDISKGVFVIKILSKEELESFNKEVKNLKFPEFKDGYKGPYAMGGFGALGIPSSFHHKIIRIIRAIVKHRLREYLKPVYTGKYIEGFFDRFCIRNKAFGTIQQESWHQDILDPRTFKDAEFEPSDIMYGGWLNLNTAEDQHFICVPYSQNDRMGETVGFAPVKDSSKIQYYTSREKTIVIPPGYAIFIQQGLVHRVNPVLPKQNSYRLFHGFRITTSKEQIVDLDHVFEKLAVPLMPSGQVPPLYARLHWVNSRHKLEIFADNMNDIFTYYRKVKSGKDKDSMVKVPGSEEFETSHSMKGLREYGIWTEKDYDYTDIEKSYFKPEKI